MIIHASENTVTIYYKITKKLKQKFCCLDFTIMDCSILQIVVLLRGKFLPFKVSVANSNMFAGVLGSILGHVYDKT